MTHHLMIFVTCILMYKISLIHFPALKKSCVTGIIQLGHDSYHFHTFLDIWIFAYTLFILPDNVNLAFFLLWLSLVYWFYWTCFQRIKLLEGHFLLSNPWKYFLIFTNNKIKLLYKIKDKIKNKILICLELSFKQRKGLQHFYYHNLSTFLKFISLFW